MRLIDADELKRYINIYDVACGCDDNHQKEILEAIDQQSPVELSEGDSIDRVDTLKAIEDYFNPNHSTDELPASLTDFLIGVGLVISSQPPAHPEIIRCKDCKHRPIWKNNYIEPPEDDDEKCPCLCEDPFYSWIPRDDFFCANGERGKRNEEN